MSATPLLLAVSPPPRATAFRCPSPFSPSSPPSSPFPRLLNLSPSESGERHAPAPGCSAAASRYSLRLSVLIPHPLFSLPPRLPPLLPVPSISPAVNATAILLAVAPSLVLQLADSAPHPVTPPLSPSPILNVSPQNAVNATALLLAVAPSLVLQLADSTLTLLPPSPFPQPFPAERGQCHGAAAGCSAEPRATAGGLHSSPLPPFSASLQNAVNATALLLAVAPPPRATAGGGLVYQPLPLHPSPIRFPHNANAVNATALLLAVAPSLVPQLADSTLTPPHPLVVPVLAPFPAPPQNAVNATALLLAVAPSLMLQLADSTLGSDYQSCDVTPLTPLSPLFVPSPLQRADY
ncbi:unnamed protein product [Closterium sp. NIES-54]